MLEALHTCPACRGAGQIVERHDRAGCGELLDCDCPFASVTPDVADAIDRGAAYSIEPAPEYLKRMAQ